MTKACSKCGEIKSAEGFYRARHAKDGFQSQCKICRQKYEQSEKYKQYQRQYQRQYRKSEKSKQSQRQYRKSENGKQYDQQYAQQYAQSEKYKQYNQSEKRKQSQRKNGNIYRTRKTQAGGSYSPAEWYNLCKFYDFHCLRCNKKLPFEKLTLDHVKPVAQGGSSFIFNTQPLCGPCNSRKNNKEIDYRQTLPDWIDRDGPILIQGSLF